MNLPTIVRFRASLYWSDFLNIFAVDLNALAWLEDYLQTWPGTLLVV